MERLSNIQKDFFSSITEDITEEEYRAMKKILNKAYEKVMKNFNE